MENRFSHDMAHMIRYTHCNNKLMIRAASRENRLFAYAKTKAQISFEETAKLNCAFVFATDQLCGNREADQRLCFCYKDITIPLLPKSEISSL